MNIKNGCGDGKHCIPHQLTLTSLSGSLHSRSHNRPVSGTSVGRTIRRICSISCKSGLKPPWQQKIFSSIIAAIGKQLKQSVNVFHSLMLYRRLHSSKNPDKWRRKENAMNEVKLWANCNSRRTINLRINKNFTYHKFD